MSGSQITNTQTLPDPAFLEPFDCNKVTMDLDTLSIFFHNFFQLKSCIFIAVL